MSCFFSSPFFCFFHFQKDNCSSFLLTGIRHWVSLNRIINISCNMSGGIRVESGGAPLKRSGVFDCYGKLCTNHCSSLKLASSRGPPYWPGAPRSRWWQVAPLLQPRVVKLDWTSVCVLIWLISRVGKSTDIPYSSRSTNTTIKKYYCKSWSTESTSLLQ